MYFIFIQTREKAPVRAFPNTDQATSALLGGFIQFSIVLKLGPTHLENVLIHYIFFATTNQQGVEGEKVRMCLCMPPVNATIQR